MNNGNFDDFKKTIKMVSEDFDGEKSDAIKK